MYSGEKDCKRSEAQEEWKGKRREFSSRHIKSSVFSSGSPGRLVELVVDPMT